MTKRFLTAVGVLALAACGSDSSTGNALCDKANTVGANVTAKLANCVANAGADIGASCTTKIASCTAADQAVLSTVLDCINAALPATPYTAAQCTTLGPALETALDTCTDTTHANVSTACRNSMLGGSSTSSAGSCYANGTVNGASGGACIDFPTVSTASAVQAACSSIVGVPGMPSGATATYQSTACASTQNSVNRLGTCTLTFSGIQIKISTYGPSANASQAQTQCTSQSGTWTAG